MKANNSNVVALWQLLGEVTGRRDLWGRTYPDSDRFVTSVLTEEVESVVASALTESGIPFECRTKVDGSILIVRYDAL